MKLKSITVAISLLLGTSLGSTPVWADSHMAPGKAMNKEQRSMGNEERMQSRPMEESRMQEEERTREHMGQEEGNKGMEKQREMKSEQEQKELGKGSEQGQESREKRKKWWRFWE